MISEICDIKNLKKNCEVEVDDSLFDVNERLIRYQSEEIKFLWDEINNKSLKNFNDQNFSHRSDLVILIIRLKIQNPKTNNSLNLRKQLKRNNLKTIKEIMHLLINANR